MVRATPRSPDSLGLGAAKFNMSMCLLMAEGTGNRLELQELFCLRPGLELKVTGPVLARRPFYKVERSTIQDTFNPPMPNTERYVETSRFITITQSNRGVWMPKVRSPMFKWYKHIALLAVLPSAVLADRFDNLGVPATEQDLHLWDTNIRADYQGLPTGLGTVSQEDCFTSRDANLATVPRVLRLLYLAPWWVERLHRMCATAKSPHSTTHKGPVSTLMRLPTLATLIDYIGRAMPWDTPNHSQQTKFMR